MGETKDGADITDWGRAVATVTWFRQPKQSSLGLAKILSRR